MKIIYSFCSRLIKAFLMLLIPTLSFAQNTANVVPTSSKKSLFAFDIDTALFFIVITLAFVILIFVGVLRSAVRFHFNSKKINDTIQFFITGAVFCLSIQYASAQEVAPAVKANQQFVFSNQGWFMLVVIALELYALFSIRSWLKYFTGIESYEARLIKSKINAWDKINAFQPLDQEASIDTGHNYDGIRELDNITPPWFIGAFIGTILFAAVYLYRYHIAHSAPSQIQEYEMEMKEAGLRQLEYLKFQGNLIDENSVTLLKEGEYDEGKSIYKTACEVCHGDKGQGLVGPNMTDDYWIHGGSVKNIFSIIKYGVLDKGMKSWKEDYSPNQIAQLSSYIISLKGTNPPNQKAAQGDLYKEEAISEPMPSDSSKLKK